eukprot:scaffold55911_cov69-Phaeocystis_antarctica.AAC.3
MLHSRFRRERLHAGEQPRHEVILRHVAIRRTFCRGPARPRDSAKAGDAPHRLDERCRARAVTRSSRAGARATRRAARALQQRRQHGARPRLGAPQPQRLHHGRLVLEVVQTGGDVVRCRRRAAVEAAHQEPRHCHKLLHHECQAAPTLLAAQAGGCCGWVRSAAAAYPAQCRPSRRRTCAARHRST